MTDFLTIWWVWIGLGLALAALEVLLPGFIFLGIAIGATVLGLLQLILPGVFTEMSDTALFAVFGGLSLLSWIGLRMAFKSQTSDSKTFAEDVND